MNTFYPKKQQKTNKKRNNSKDFLLRSKMTNSTYLYSSDMNFCFISLFFWLTSMSSFCRTSDLAPHFEKKFHLISFWYLVKYSAEYKISGQIFGIPSLKYTIGYPFKPNIWPDSKFGIGPDAVYNKSGYPIGHISSKHKILNLISS